MTRLDHSPVRKDLLETATALLVGPLEESEEIASPPVDTYLTGILWPEGEILEAGEDEGDEGSPYDQDGEMDSGVPGYRAGRPCSFGLTFAVDEGTTVVVSTARTARYYVIERPVATKVEVAAEDQPESPGDHALESDHAGNSQAVGKDLNNDEENVVPADGGDKKGDKPLRKWVRRELGYTYEIKPGPARTWFEHGFTGPDGKPIHDAALRLHIRRRIVEGQQVITVTLINKAIQTDDRHRDEFCLMQSGLTVSAVCSDGSGAIRPRPSIIPVGADEDTQSAALLYRDVEEYAVGHGIAVSWEPSSARRISALSTSWMPTARVKSMSASGHSSLQEFLKEQPQSLSAAWLSRHDARDEIISTLSRFAGIYAKWISSNLAPRLNTFGGTLKIAAERNLKTCNEALERIQDGIETLETYDSAWDAFTLANAAMDRQSQFEAKGDRRSPLIWRPFQLAYLLMVIPGLVDPDDQHRNCVDLLWFPTGGGKTEAYLGLAAFEIFLRRLTDAGRRSRGGVDVLMRYTLRLLTVQQFQRAASLICACEAIRLERGDLGSAPISLGLYVGGDATPNRAADAIAALEQERNRQQPKSTPRQLLDCPVCGSSLNAACYTATVDGRSIEIRCAKKSCPVFGEPLPVLTVDDFIYDNPPSMLIGTVDKFAQLPRRSDLRVLFGLNGGRRPGLIIQDELHLISGPLGSMTGLYETVVDLLCTSDGVRPKVIGSTATIGQAAKQVRALFDRSVLQFPPSGFEAADSFFAVTDETGADRLYLGLCSAGRSPKFALQAAASALLQGAGYLVAGGTEASLVNPFWTCVLYFNSLRELGGAHVLLQDDVPRQIAFLASRLEKVSGLKKARRELETDAIELSSRVPSRDLPDYLAQLGIGLAEDQGDPFAPQPRDAVLASNMISVGVDVPRLGLMLVNGQPKSTAEYIQASSRVGRGIDGLVLTLYNFGRPRDVSHFEHFMAYHGALYRSVEATSVTPWAPRARDKALHAVVAAAVRHLCAGMSGDGDAADFQAEAQTVQSLIEAIRNRANSASDGIEAEAAAEDLEAIVYEWAQRSQEARSGGGDLLYWERKAPYGKTKPHLMTSAEEGARSTGLAWPTPNSMREVEPSTAFVLKIIHRN